MEFDSRMNREVSGNSSIPAIRSAPIWVGSTTLLAPACSSLRSVETASPRAMISIVRLRLRALSVMKTLAASFGSTLASARARAMPASCSIGLVGGVALNAEVAGLACLLDPARILLDHHGGRAAVLQRLRKLDADAAIAANDDVVVEFIDFCLHAPAAQ